MKDMYGIKNKEIKLTNKNCEKRKKKEMKVNK